MENENKTEEKIAEVTPQTEGAEKKCFMKRFCKNCCKGQCKGKGGMILGVIVLALLIAGSYGYRQYRQKIDIGQEAIKTKTNEFLKGKIPEGVAISSVTKENGVYKVILKADEKQGGQEQPIYVSADGNKIFQGAIDMKQGDPTADAQAQAPEKTEAEQKNDVPVVDLFVMSYCPYGLQMEKGVLPAVEALGNKIKFNLKFVDYTLHGPKEVTENVNQYCIGKTQPAKLGAYLKCFWKSSTGTAAACMKTAGINVAQVTTCVADTNKEFNPTEKTLGLNKDETVKFGVQGSPTLVINGTTVSSGRDSASVLKAICSGFTTQPKECSAKLSATSPSAGFDDQATAAAAGGAATAGAACATPQ